MVKTKSIETDGQVLNVDPNTFQRKPIEITYTQAKKLMKKELSEKQKQHTDKLVEANRLRWQQKKEEKMKQLENQVKQELEQKQKNIKEGKVQEVIVKPKRIYKNKLEKEIKSKVQAYNEELEEDSQTESSEEEIIIKRKSKPKKIIVVESSDEEPPELVPKSKLKSQVKPSVDIDTKIETIKKIDDTLNRINKYAGLVRF